MAAVQSVIFGLVILFCVFSSGICDEENIELDTNSDTLVAEGRTFGHHFLKRLSFAVIPAAFVVGVITTLLSALTVVSLKGLGVGLILLILALGQLLARTVHTIPAPAHYSAPLPLVYGHHHSREVPVASPIWLEKDWA